MGRKVAVYQYKNYSDGMGRYKDFIGKGIFHKFGVDYIEVDNGAVDFTTAIVEMDDGEVLNIRAELIIFKKDDDE